MPEPWKPEPFDTFFLFGTWICEGSWDSIREAILDVDELAPVHVESTPAAGQSHWEEVRAANDAANFWFADLVHKRRRIQAFLGATPEELERRSNLRSTSQIEEFRVKLRDARDRLAKIDRDVKDAIVRRLKKAVAAETLRVRPQFWKIMGDERFRGSAWFTSGAAVAIDGAGLAYGYAGLLSTGESSSFAYAGGTDMTLFGEKYDMVGGVSPSGLLVGCRYSLDGGASRPAVFSNGAAVTIAPDVLAFRGCLTAANDAGMAVGGFQTAHEIGAYVWNGSSASVLPMEVVKSINASGRVAGAKVVGSITPRPGADTFFVTHAAVWLGGAEAQDLNELRFVQDRILGFLPSGVTLWEASAINDAGAIAGFGSAGAFLLTPRD